MTKPMLLADFTRLPPVLRAVLLDGLSGAIDTVAEQAPVSHRFLRFQWFAAALRAYGGRARTILVERDGEAVAALPLVGFGPAAAGLAMVPGCYWPFRSFPVHEDAPGGVHDLLLDRLAGTVNALRIGPVCDGDAATAPLLAAARARGWAVLDRFVADSFVLDLTTADWPRGSTLRKNRFHERHLGDHGALDWQVRSGGDLAFDVLATIEEKSWIAARTDGRDAKFTRVGHGAFWRAAASDPVLAGTMSASLLAVGGVPAAFSFDLDTGPLRYAIANSYDPVFARQSPGKLLQYRNLVAARARGITQVDWGAGDSGYKQTIGAVAGATIRDWLIVRPGLPAMLGRALAGRWGASGQG